MNMLFYIAFMTGLASSFHCVGMCGAIALALPIGKFSLFQAMLSRILYHIGRIMTYSFLGYIAGYFGSQFFIAGFQQQVSITIGVLMLLLIIPSRIRIFNPFQKQVLGLQRILKKYLNSKSPFGFLLLGILNGLLPCGMVYIALAGSMAANTPQQGAIIMAFFGLGTAPLMFGVSMVMKCLNNKVRQKINKYLPIYSFVLALFFVVRGMNLGIAYISPTLEKHPLSDTIPTCHKPLKMEY